MHRLSVGEQNNPKLATFHLLDPDPASDTTVSLNLLPQRVGYGPLEQLIQDRGPALTLPISRKYRVKFTRPLYQKTKTPFAECPYLV